MWLAIQYCSILCSYNRLSQNLVDIGHECVSHPMHQRSWGNPIDYKGFLQYFPTLLGQDTSNISLKQWFEDIV